MFEMAERNKLFMTIGIALAAAPAIGPLLGGYLSQHYGWRSNFSFLIIMGSVLFILCIKQLTETYNVNNSTRAALIPLMKTLLCDSVVMRSAWLVGTINAFIFGFYAEAPFIFIN